jgi:hypothetical protein
MDTTSPPVDVDALADRIAETAALLGVATHRLLTDRPPVEVVVHVDAATLVGEEEQTGISAETSRRLLCDAGTVPIQAMIRFTATAYAVDAGLPIRNCRVRVESAAGVTRPASSGLGRTRGPTA